MFFDRNRDPLEGLTIAFIVVIIAVAIGIIAGAGFAFKFLAFAIPIFYLILNIGFIAEQFENFEFLGSAIPILVRIVKVIMLGKFAIYDTYTGLELPNIDEISGLFATLGAALEVVYLLVTYSLIIAVVLVVDYLISMLELFLTLTSDSIVINHIVCFIFSIIWAILFFKFIY